MGEVDLPHKVLWGTSPGAWVVGIQGTEGEFKERRRKIRSQEALCLVVKGWWTMAGECVGIFD
jgi:hypothetical protein